MRHEDLTLNHILERWVYANASARTGASGFVSTDVGKVAYQSDTKQYWRLASTAPTWQPVEPPAANSQATPANPIGTASLVGVMMGLASLFTPIKSGNILILITGSISNNTASDGGKAQVRYGVGSAPANGAALTGTGIGNQPQVLNNANTAAIKSPIALAVIVTGLTLGTLYWIDVALTAITGGTANLTDVTTDVIEL